MNRPKRIEKNRVYVVHTYHQHGLDGRWYDKHVVRFMRGDKIKTMGLHSADVEHFISSDWHGRKARVDDGHLPDYQPVMHVNNASIEVQLNNRVATLI